LIDIHPDSYFQLLIRANYDVDSKSYLELTNHLYNLSLLEVSFTGNKIHGNSEAHKKAKKNHKSKLGKAQCRKHPNHEHTWADCYDNPKNKNKNKKGKEDFKKPQKAEVRAISVDSDEDMNRTLNDLITGVEEVRENRIDVEVQSSVEPSTHDTHSLSPVTPIRNENSMFKGTGSTKTKRLKKKPIRTRKHKTIFSKKRRLINELECFLGIANNLKNASTKDEVSVVLNTEVSALVKNVTGSPSMKLPSVLIDTGCSKTLVKREHVPSGLKLLKKPVRWTTNGGTFSTQDEVELTIVLPEFSSSMEIQWVCSIDDNPNATYDMIIGRDLQSALRMDISFSTSSITWNEMTIPMRTGQQKTKEELNSYLDSLIEIAGDPDLIKGDLFNATKILDSNYKKADLEEVVKNFTHLTEEEQSAVRILLYRFESLFEGKLGLWDTPPISLELEEGAKPFHACAFPIP